MKTTLPLDKHGWSPSPLPGQIVLVTTLDGDGGARLAPKSWVSLAAFGPPPVLLFGCSLDHATARNALERGQFAVNVPGEELAARVWRAAEVAGPERWRVCGLTPLPARCVAPPLVAECRAHLECETEGHRAWGREVVVFGRVRAVSVDDALTRLDLAERYAALAPIFYLEYKLAAGLGPARAVP